MTCTFIANWICYKDYALYKKIISTNLFSMNTLEQLLYRDSLAASLSDSSKATAFVFLNSLATSNLNIDYS